MCTTSPGAQDLTRHVGFVCVHNLTRCTRSHQTCRVCVCAQPHQVHKISPDMKGLCVCTTSPGAQDLTRHVGFVCVHNLTRCTRSHQTCRVCVCAQPHQVHKISPDMKGLCVCTTSPGAQDLPRHVGFVCVHNLTRCTRSHQT